MVLCGIQVFNVRHSSGTGLHGNLFSSHLTIPIYRIKLPHLRLEMLDICRVCLLWQVIINLVIYYNSILYNLVIFFSMEDRNETTCMQGDNIWLYTEDKARHVTCMGHHHCISIAAVLEHISKLPEYLINFVIFF